MEEVDNTAEAWGAKLLALAEEAARDAGARDSGLVLAQTLDDLSRVLVSYAARLDVEPVAANPLPEPSGDALKAAGAEEASLTEGEAAVLADIQRKLEPPVLAAPSAAFDPSDLYGLLANLTERVALLENAPAFDLPGWLRETLQSHHDYLELHETRITQLEAALAEALNRIAWLENNIGLSGVSVTDDFVAEAPLNPDDYNPEAWGSIERAREALSRQVRREHTKLAGIRQTVLNAVIALTNAVDPSEDDRAQLMQHRDRADRLDQIDSIRDVKLDEIAALDDLDAAKAYRAELGWPR